MMKMLLTSLPLLGLLLAPIEANAQTQQTPSKSALYMEQMIGSLAGQIAQLREALDAAQVKIQQDEGKLKDLQAKVDSQALEKK